MLKHILSQYLLEGQGWKFVQVQYVSNNIRFMEIL
jgi:hypothetical protein